MISGRQTGRKQQRGPVGSDSQVTYTPTGSFYSVRGASRFNSDMGFGDESFHWQPGATLPVTSTPSRVSHRSSGTHRGNVRPAHLAPESESSEEETSRSVKATLEAILSAQNALQKQMHEVLCRVNHLEDSVKESSISSNASSSASCDERKRKKRLSSELCGKVAAIYEAMAVEDKFHLSERGDSVWNKKIKAKVREEIRLHDKENGFMPADVDAAVKRYFESRKRMHRESKPEHRERVTAQEKQRKARSRRQWLFDRRKRCVRDTEQTWWDQLSIDFMSFESSDEEDVINVHSLPWRSNKLKEFLSVLDKRADDIRSKIKHHAADRKPRLLSEPAAESIPPQNSPKWTISKEWKKDHVQEGSNHAINLDLDLSSEGLD